MDLKDKLNLLWKYLFLALIAYGVFSVTCGINNCRTFHGKSQYSCDWKKCDRDGADYQMSMTGDKAFPHKCQKPGCAKKNMPDSPDNK